MPRLYSDALVNNRSGSLKTCGGDKSLVIMCSGPVSISCSLLHPLLQSPHPLLPPLLLVQQRNML